MGHPRLSVGESILFIHACVNYVVVVSRNLERANENDGFKMTALESCIKLRYTQVSRPIIAMPTIILRHIVLYFTVITFLFHPSLMFIQSFLNYIICNNFEG